MVIAATLANFVLDLTLPSGYNVADLYAVTVIAVAGVSHSVRAVMTATGIVVVATWVTLLVKWSSADLTERVEFLVERGVATLLMVLSALVVTLILARDHENLRLGSQLRQAEADRDADQRMLAAASAVAAIGTWSIDRQDNRVKWSDTAALMHGHSLGYQPTAEELLGYLTPEDSERFATALEFAWADGTPFREELMITLSDGAQRWIVAMGETLRGDGDSVGRVHGTVQDITPWKLAEVAAATQLHRFSQLTERLPIIVWTADAEGRIDYFNDALLNYTGASAEELLADQWVSAVDPQDLDLVSREWGEALKSGQPYDVEFRVKGADGIFRWHHVSAQPEHDESGKVVRWWGSSVNVDGTRRLRDEAATLTAERSVILESINDGVCALDSDWQIVYINNSAARILGRTPEELVGHVIWDLYPEGTGAQVHKIMNQAMQEGRSERLSYFSDYLDKWLEMSVTHSEVGITVFFRDMTEVRQLSDQLSQAQRLEAVGQLTGGIAHDFNNLLTVVLGGADALTQDESLAGEAHEMAAMIATAAGRGAELTHRLLAFARRQPLEPKSVDLAERLLALEPLLRRTIGEHISIVVAPVGINNLAEVDPGQFENALLNLAINARDAMPQGGSLTIEVETVTLDEKYVTAHAEVQPGTYAVTTVTDSGVGIAPESLGRLFDPFYTTKEIGKGSGLGLAMVWGFVKQSGGHVTVYSEPGFGASFKLYLPASAAPPAPVDRPKPASTRSPVTGTILVAEDDDLVRRFATERLLARGYDVVEAGTGPEALEALKSMDRVDLLFTDVVMPGGMTGRHLADAVVALRPGTPVLYASGYTENVIIHNGRLDKGVQLLAKPYSARQLIDRVADLLAPEAEEAT